MRKGSQGNKTKHVYRIEKENYIVLLCMKDLKDFLEDYK